MTRREQPAESELTLRRFTGPLTTELLQTPGRFGLGQVPSRLKPDNTTGMVCGFCSVGCGLNVHLRESQAVNLTPNPEYPVNLGMACPKGWEALTPLSAKDRAATPLLRGADGALRPVDWDAALQTFTLRMRAIQDQFGPHSIAFLGSGQMPTEELAFLGCLAKFGMGMRHGDANTRQCMATSVAAYKEAFGFDAPPYTYQDFEESDTLVFIGANPCVAHPILWQRVMRNQSQPRILVVDPRRTETAQAATRHYPLRPKSDLLLLQGLARLLLDRGAVDHKFIQSHTTGFDAHAAFLASLDMGEVVAATGLPLSDLEEFAGFIASGKRVSFWWTMGVNQSHEGTRAAQAIINLSLMTGQIGRPGTGPNSITGQCNAMGSRLFSNTTNLLGGHDFKNPAHRAKIAGVLGIPEDKVTREPGWAYDQILDGIDRGEIRGLWIIGTNTAHSWIDQGRARGLLKKLDFLVAQDMFADTDTAQAAHLFLPAAAWGEKEGTFINSERRLGLLKKVSRAPGQALSDFNIFTLVAQYWGCGGMFTRWSSPEAVLGLLKEASRGQPCDITGIDGYSAIDEQGGVQWPHPAGAPKPAQQRRLFEDGKFHHPDGRARFVFERSRPAPELADASYPFILLTGRGTSAQWHTQTRTGRSAILARLHPATLCAEIHPDDAAALGVVEGAPVRIWSRRSSLAATAILTATVGRGHVFLPMHYEEVNRLTLEAVDPHSRQPSYKHCAVAMEPLRAARAKNPA